MIVKERRDSPGATVPAARAAATPVREPREGAAAAAAAASLVGVSEYWSFEN